MEEKKSEERKFKLNRLETTKLMGPWVDEHWASIRVAKAQGKKIAWSIGPLFPFAYAMGITCHFYAGYAAYCGGRKGVPPILEAAEAGGQIIDTCSYHRLHLGMIDAIEKNIPIKEDVLQPIPDLILCGRLCPEHSQIGDSLFRRLKVPAITLDLPPPQKEEDLKPLENYAKRQCYEVVIPQLEEFCGRKFNYDRLSEILAVLKKAAMIRNECWKFFERIPSPWTLWDYAVSIAPVFYLMGQQRSIDYYQQLLDELKQRAGQGISAIAPEERFRVYWDGWIPWTFLGTIMRKLVSFGANPIVGRYPWEFFPHPEHIDPERPVDTLIEQWYSYRMATGSSPEFFQHSLAEWIEQYSLDGLIMYASRTCRVWNLGELDIIDDIERKYGIPGIVIEADMIDPKFFSEAQIDIRLQALFEMIEARRKRKR
ncbi:MAG: hypothetical protein A3G93_03115 [Nitrospinae bacterium RIFCSPLOWO2_12_FULL_45_22]|nr:MAG: hypothetical protein A3G93_03115 [Nitrospinae bacterium RIFCSPLOWO2_12_FULL_45_22]